MDVKRVAQSLKRGHLLVVLSFCSLAAGRHCLHHQQYWDSRAQLCRPCTRCPLNQIIRKPCHRHGNTVCGPFREFSYFHQLENPEDASYTSYEFETLFSENSSGLEMTRSFPRRSGGGRVNEPVVEKDDGEYWKSLALALIGVLCVLIFVATMVVLIACKKLHETAAAAAVKHPEEDDDDDSGYVVIRAIRPPNRLLQPGGVASPRRTDPSCSAARALLSAGGDDPPAPTETFASPGRAGVVCGTKGVYVPRRQLLNYAADDVFGSGDSLASGASCDVPPQHVVDCAEDRVSICREL